MFCFLVMSKAIIFQTFLKKLFENLIIDQIVFKFCRPYDYLSDFMKKVVALIIVALVACCGIYAYQNAIDSSSDNSIVDISKLEIQDNLNINTETNVEKKLYTTNKSDTNAILVENNSTLTISNSAVNKSGDSSDNGDSCDFYGTNSAILVRKNSTAVINKVEIETNSTGSNAIFVTNAEYDGTLPQGNTQANNPNGQAPEMPNENGGQSDQKPPEIPYNMKDNQIPPMDNQNPQSAQDALETNNPQRDNGDYSEGNATSTVDNVLINTYKDKSRGLDATYGGKITANNVVIKTRGASCAAVATDRGEGTIEVHDSQLNTGVDNGTGRGSPCIYSTGNISVNDSTGLSNKSQIACIEGKNSITLTDCRFNCSAMGNREDNGEFVDLGGIFIYQSMSGDANLGTAIFNASNCELSINEDSDYYDKAPMFHVTNTDSNITIKDCTLSFGSGTLLNVSGQNQWGNIGNNGGNVAFDVIEEKIEGNIFIDEISSLNLSLQGSKYTGCINPADNPGQTDVVLDSESTWTLTGDSHITSLENEGNIDYGNYTLFVNGKAYTSSNQYGK